MKEFFVFIIIAQYVETMKLYSRTLQELTYWNNQRLYLLILHITKKFTDWLAHSRKCIRYIHPDVWPPQYYFWMTSHFKTYESFHKIWLKCGSWNLKHTIHHFTMFYLVSMTTIFIRLSAYTRTTFLLEQHGGFCNLWTSDGTRSVQRCSYVQSLISIKCILHNGLISSIYSLFNM